LREAIGRRLAHTSSNVTDPRSFAALRQSSPHATYVIVGGGSAGCVLANRLSEDPAASVLLLEAGAPDSAAILRMPLTWLTAAFSTRYGWGYQSQPEPNAGNRCVPIPRGKVLGGCSSINGMIYARGHSTDYDGWAASGLSGWSFAKVLPYFCRSESNWRGDSVYHGSRGPLKVSRVHDPTELGRTILMEAARELGYACIDDCHAAVEEGFLVPDFTIHGGQRMSAAVAYLRPAMHRPNLRIITGAYVTRVMLAGARATGVEFEVNGVRTRAHADAEVILAAGAFNSPKTLLLSGIGPASELSRVGIKPVHDLAGVGHNLQEHPTIFALYRASDANTFEAQLRMDRLIRSVARWILFKSGTAASMPFGIEGYCRSEAGLDRPDVQLMATPVAMHARPWFPLLRPGVGHFISAGGLHLHPLSRGVVRLRSADAYAAPEICFNLLAADADRIALRRCVQIIRAWLGSKAAARLVGAEVMPGPDVRSDAELDAYVRNGAGISHHPVGTCAMGNSPESVVDAQLRVHGLERLRVADASVMPTIVGGNTNAPTVMIAEKAADMILGRGAPTIGSLQIAAGGSL
jgi:choline dehydrogenase